MYDGNLTRFEFDGTVEHRSGQQFVNGKGFAGDVFRRAHRPESHGFASHPVRGGQGLLMGARGRRDAAYVLGGENPGMRPVLDPGCAALYDQHGGILKFITNGLVLDVGNRKVTFTAGGWEVNGPCTINGDLEVRGNIHATGSIIDDGGNTPHHSH